MTIVHFIVGFLLFAGITIAREALDRKTRP